MTSRALPVPRHLLRWALPAGLAATFIVTGSGAFSSDPAAHLPTIATSRLVADVESAHVDGLAGTVRVQMSLGLPALPATGAGDPTSLLAGSHTARVWLAGTNHERVAVLDAADETDVYRNGAQVWLWSSAANTATHSVLPVSRTAATPAGVVPQHLVQGLLTSIGRSSTAVAGSSTVAGRAAYQLVVRPRDPRSRIGSVHIAVDRATKVPLGVQVYARRSAEPAIDVAFTQIDFGAPSAAAFRFTPPKSATVKQATVANGGSSRSAAPVPRIIGRGWTTVVELPAGAGAANSQTTSLLHALPRVHGSWGRGRLFRSALITALITDDGRVFAGAVEPSVLYAAAGSHR